MQVVAPGRDVTVITFPADDAVFAERVDELVTERLSNALDLNLAIGLEEALRVVHPHVTTSFRDGMAGLGDRVLYVFRDGSARSSLVSDAWITDDSVARVVTDAEGRYLDANEAAERVFGASRQTILEARAGSFTRPDARIEDAPAIWRALARTGRLHSLAVVTRPNGSDISVEFVTIRDADRPGRHVTYLREVE